MTLMEQYQDAQAKVEEARLRARELAKPAFEDGVTGLFTEYPELQSFCWTQYTPYFNDGDNCYFGVNEVSIQTLDAQNDDDYGPEPLRTIVENFRDAFAADDLEHMWGDHARVRVTRSGVEVESYEHD